MGERTTTKKNSKGRRVQNERREGKEMREIPKNMRNMLERLQ